jgi:hypothetical protein
VAHLGSVAVAECVLDLGPETLLPNMDFTASKLGIFLAVRDGRCSSTGLQRLTDLVNWSNPKPCAKPPGTSYHRLACNMLLISLIVLPAFRLAFRKSDIADDAAF